MNSTPVTITQKKALTMTRIEEADKSVAPALSPLCTARNASVPSTGYRCVEVGGVVPASSSSVVVSGSAYAPGEMPQL